MPAYHKDRDPLKSQRPPVWVVPVAKLYLAAVGCTALLVFCAGLLGYDAVQPFEIGFVSIVTSMLTLLGVLLAHASRIRFSCFLAGFFVISYASSFQSLVHLPVLVFMGIHTLGIAIPLKLLRVNLRRVPSGSPPPGRDRQFSIADLMKWTAVSACLIGSLRWFIASPHLNSANLWTDVHAATLGMPVGLAAVWTGVSGDRGLLVRGLLLVAIAILSGLSFNAHDPFVTYVLILDGCLVARTMMMVTYRPAESVLEPTSGASTLHCSSQDSGLP